MRLRVEQIEVAFKYAVFAESSRIQPHLFQVVLIRNGNDVSLVVLGDLLFAISNEDGIRSAERQDAIDDGASLIPVIVIETLIYDFAIGIEQRPVALFVGRVERRE